MLKQITDFTHKIEHLAVKTGFVYKAVSRYYRNVVHKEVALAQITEKDHILCIGGGMCPFSAILFHQVTGAQVTVIDNNEKCIPKAQKVIDRLGIGDKVRVLYQEGDSEDISFANYTVVHFALQVSPINQVFESVEKQVSAGTRLLIRRPKKQLSSMYCRFADYLISRCTVTIHKARNIGSTALYIKDKDASDKVSGQIAVA